jgi:hypothetical protein
MAAVGIADCNRQVSKVTDILSEIVNENKKGNVNKDLIEKQKKYVFYAKHPVSISIAEYIDRIVKYTKVEESTVILALIYIDRLCDFNGFILTDRNIHRIILVSIIIAIKYNEDDIYTNSFYAKVGGVSKIELNSLEVEFTKMLRYSLFVNESTYIHYKSYYKQYKVEKCK